MTRTEYKSNIIQRIGGEQDFQFVILSLVDRLQDDRRLAQYFGAHAINTGKLAAHQERLLKAIFDDVKHDDINYKIRSRYASLITLGFNERHFDLMVSHFIEALEDAWVSDQEVIGEAVALLKSFRHIFESQNCKVQGRLSRRALSGVSAC